MLRLILIASLLVSAFGGLVPSPRKDADSGRIIGGDVTSDNTQFPYMAELYSSTKTCGGAILNENVILSAASCVNAVNVDLWYVHVGSVVSQSGGQTVRFQKVVAHPQFNKSINDYDIALVFVNYPLVLDNITVKAITLPKQDEPIPVATRGKVAGWGGTTNTGAYSSVLRNVTVMVIDQALCMEEFIVYPYRVVSDRMVCASYSRTENDVTSGDRGSPMAVDGVVIGITSWGSDFYARVTRPAVWTRVPLFVDWIEEQLND